MTTTRYEVSHSVATITLDAPARRNALSAEMLVEIQAHFNVAANDPRVRSVVLTHTGPVFCSGMDLTQADGSTSREQTRGVASGAQPVVAFPALLMQIWEFEKPVLARVAGKARAGGIGLIAACDIAISTPEADFGFTEVRLGLVPAVISVPVLRRMAPRAVLELFLTGETFGADRAREIGLINLVTEDIDTELNRFTEMLRLGEPNALAATKALLRRNRGSLTMAEDFVAMAQLSAGYFEGPQAREGIAAFAERRRPSWAG